MSDVIVCPHCGCSFSWREQYAGRKVRCRQCRGEFVVPPPIVQRERIAEHVAVLDGIRPAGKPAHVRKFPLWPIPTGITILALLVIVSASAYFGGSRAVQAIVQSPEQAAVRSWLRSNLDEPIWDEVQWWDPVTFRRDNSELLELYRQGKIFDDPPPYQEDIFRVLRVKLRTRNRFGAIELKDLCFTLDAQTLQIIEGVDYARIHENAKAQASWWYAGNFEELYNEHDEVNGDFSRGQKANAKVIGDLADGVYSDLERDRKTPRQKVADK